MSAASHATPRLANLAILLTLAMAMPMTLLYAVSALGPQLVRELGIAPAALGYFTLGSFGAAALLSLRAGEWVAQLGARRALAMLFAAVALTFALMAALPGFYSLLTVTVLLGLAQALANPATNVLIAQHAPPAHKAMLVGLKQSGVQMAALAVGLLLPSAALAWGWRAAFAALAAPACLLMWRAWRLPEPAAVIGAPLARAPINARLAALMAAQGCVGVSLSAFLTFLPLHAASLGMSPASAGLLVALFGAMGMAARLVLTPLGARLREEAWLLAGLLLLAMLSLGVALSADAFSLDWLWLGAAGMGLSAPATNAIAMSMLIRDPGFGGVATSAGRVSAAFFAGFALGPLMMGALGGPAAPVAGWWALLGVLALGVTLALALGWLRQRGGHHAHAA